ncbi:MAG: hypothetical protein KAW67_06600 [Candidatus Eisenbacteria sp.]|nr:hypothetical protein [Candidatus Eisenbacteria bacterium]
MRDWADSRWLRPHATSREEIASLLGIVERDLADAGQGISADWKFGIAYNAALRLCTVLLHAEGFRPERTLQHYRTIQALGLILGSDSKADVEYLEVCRKKRNIIEYDAAGTVTDRDAKELAAFVVELRDRVLAWLREHHAELLES